VTIQRKYCDKDIWIAFPHKGFWYLIEHKHLIDKVEAHTDWLDSISWKEKHGYSSISINPSLLESLVENKLGPVYGSILADETEL
jgi:hypothetical protein